MMASTITYLANTHLTLEHKLYYCPPQAKNPVSIPDYAYIMTISHVCSSKNCSSGTHPLFVSALWCRDTVLGSCHRTQCSTAHSTCVNYCKHAHKKLQKKNSGLQPESNSQSLRLLSKNMNNVKIYSS